MRRVRCVDCGRTYDYDEDAFCPKCGTFNQPDKSTLQTRTKRVDGLSEAGHQGSFLHKEFHEEERERRLTGLDKSVKRVKRVPPTQSPNPPADRSFRAGQANPKSFLNLLVWIIIAMMALSILGDLLFWRF